jgi:hypothetical protein
MRGPTLRKAEQIQERLQPCPVARGSQSGTSFPESGTSLDDYVMHHVLQILRVERRRNETLDGAVEILLDTVSDAQIFMPPLGRLIDYEGHPYRLEESSGHREYARLGG